MSAKLKHVAIVSSDHERLGAFYSTLFGMHMGGLRARADGEPPGASTITDGYVGMNVNSRKAGRQGGLDHFGFEVESVEEIASRMRDDYPMIELLQRPSNRPFAGISTHDPVGNVFDLSEKSMENRAGIYVEKKERTARHIDHLQLRVVDAAGAARFYSEVFGLEPQPKDADDPNYYLSDGTITFIIAPWKISDFAGSGIERPALDHIGFEVESLEQFQADLDKMVREHPELAPSPLHGYAEGEVRLKLFEGCRVGSYHLADPDGVLIDITERKRS
jgi:catechol 2,3-dioxygenase-like lactoylglutathione lyase family enzyme